MAKKKKGKGKGKKGKKGKKDDQKGKLSHHEREIFLLALDDLQHKIEWRNHLCSILEEDMRLYREAIDLEGRDREEGVRLLEGVVQEQREASEKAESATPYAEASKVQAGKRRARELASKLMQANEEKVSYHAQLEVLRKKLAGLEAYSAESVDEKIRDLERQLETDEDDDAFLRGREQDRRRVDAFRKEMRDILRQKADSFQDEISGKLDKNFERITEETRWWAEMADGLRIATERLESLNEIKSRDLRDSRRDLETQKEAAVQTSLRLQEGNALVSELARKQKEELATSREDERYRDQLAGLDAMAEGLRKDTDAQRRQLVETLEAIHENETEISRMEGELATEKRFGGELSKFIQRATGIISAEVQHPLVVRYDGPPAERKTLLDLRTLFEEATRFIYENKDSVSVL